MPPLDATSHSCPSRLRRRTPARSRVVAATLATLWLILTATVANGQEDEYASNGPDIDTIKARSAELEAVAEPDDDQKAELAALKSALAFLDKAAASLASTPKLAERAATAPEALAQIQADLAKAKAELETPVTVELPPEPAEANAAELEAALAPLKARLDSAKAQQTAAQQVAAKAKQDNADATARLAAIPQEIASATTRQEEVAQILRGMTAGDRSPLDLAKIANLKAEAAALAARLPELNQELQTLDVRKPIRQARIELTQVQANQAERVTTAVTKKLDRRSAAIAARRTAEAELARQEASSKHKVIGEILDANTELATEEQRVERSQQKRNTESVNVTDRLKALRASYENIQADILKVGLNDVIGLRLRTLRSELEGLRAYDQEARRVWEDIKVAQTRLIELEGQRIADPDAEAAQIIDASTDPVPASDRDDVLAAATAALTTQVEYRKSLRESYESYITTTLIPLHGNLAQITELDDLYLDFIMERILWIQSTEPISLKTLPNVSKALVWIVKDNQWAEVGRTAWRRAVERPVSTVWYFVPFLALVGLRRLLRRRIGMFASQVKRASTDHFSYTVRAALVTVLLALPIPALLWALARMLSGADANDLFALGCAAAFDRCAMILLSLTLVWHVCRPRGLAEAHFRWRQNHLKLVRRNIGALSIVIPMAFLTAVTDRETFEGYHNALGRLAFCVSMVAVAVFMWRVLHPKRGVLESVLVENRGSWLDRLQSLWFPVLVGVPIALAILACAGYFLTAREMSQRVLETAWIIILAVLIYNVMLRWLYVVQRRLAVEQLRRRFVAEREATDHQKVEGTGDGPPPEAPATLPDDVVLDVEAVSRQTRRMLKMGLTVVVLFGLYLAWAAALPALNVLDNIALWIPTGTEMVVAADGTESFPDEVVTVADIGLAILLLFVTMAVARNIPGVLEILVLQRLPMSAGGRYATRTLVSYAILIIGIIMAFGAVGIGWSKVQWLAAAVSVGLGFGLQEIFANFVSGLIILTERPVRMGDTVTVGGVSGTVTRIQMRATTITDWDRKELIIPNKEFVTGQITNWTLTNAILRLSLDVGIAYGSDTELAKQLLLEVAEAEDTVVAEPAPRALFMGFGDNSLNFQLRIFIDNVENFPLVRDKVNMAIDKAFRKANIEIAFPQRDLHIRSIDAVLPVARDGERAARPSLAIESPAAEPIA